MEIKWQPSADLIWGWKDLLPNLEKKKGEQKKYTIPMFALEIGKDPQPLGNEIFKPPLEATM